MDINKLTDEQKAKIEGKSPEEILAIAKEEGYELTEEDLKKVSGGWGYIVECTHCGFSHFVMEHGERTCDRCGKVFYG